MIAGVEGAQLTPLQVHELWRNNLLTETQISHYWDDLWSESEDEELEDEDVTEVMLAGPPGIVTDTDDTWKQTETISKFDLLFRGKATPAIVTSTETVSVPVPASRRQVPYTPRPWPQIGRGLSFFKKK